MTKSGGSPIPGSQKIVQVSWTSSDTTAKDIFRPNEGELYQLVGGDILTTGGAGSVNMKLIDAAGTHCLVMQAGVTGQEPLKTDAGTALSAPLYISYENWLYGDNISNSNMVRITISVVQIG